MTKLVYYLLLAFMLNFTFSPALAQARCYKSMAEVLPCYLKEKESVYGWQFLSSNEENNVSADTYILSSQTWPKEPGYGSVWQHKLIIYRPNIIEQQTALLYVNGGYNADKEGKQEFKDPREKVNFAAIARENKAVVVELQDVPNQYLFIAGDKPRKEDEIIAYSYKKVMSNPWQNAYWAGHLPMAKAAVKAMDAVQEILVTQHDIAIEDFVLAGASKRGWSSWLTSIGDKRVSALIPIVIDVLSVEKSINHTCSVYGQCPPALKDYVAEGVIDNLASKNAKALLKIEDPLSYLNSGKQYSDRLSIPKYIINASGDDFTVPSSQFYFNQLPGSENLLRYLPNTSHYVSNRVLDEVLGSYFNLHLNCSKLPKLNWQRCDNGFTITTDQTPKTVKLWLAHNDKERDFRFNPYPEKKGNIRYYASDVEFNCQDSSACTFAVALPKENKAGWQASFVELSYEVGGEDFILTTDVLVRWKNKVD